jgi:stage V sporulation protein AB
MYFIFLIILGLSAGFAVSCGIFAFISMIGIPPRLAGKTHTAKHINLYENMIISGGTAGNFITVLNPWLIGKQLTLCLTGFFSGIFVGCMAVTLAEVLKAIPVFAHRISLKKGLPFILFSAALGKFFGAFYQFFF